jgi:Cu/Zn superoxide dismutase
MLVPCRAREGKPGLGTSAGGHFISRTRHGALLLL